MEDELIIYWHRWTVTYINSAYLALRCGMWFSCWFIIVTLSNTSTHLSLCLPFGSIHLENNTKLHIFSILLPISYILAQLLCNRILLKHIYVTQCDEQSKSNCCSLVKWSYCQTNCPKGIVFILCKATTKMSTLKMLLFCFFHRIIILELERWRQSFTLWMTL